MSFSHGRPWFPADALSWIRPARPTVWPSCTTTRDWTERWKKVGEVMPAVCGGRGIDVADLLRDVHGDLTAAVHARCDVGDDAGLEVVDRIDDRGIGRDRALSRTASGRAPASRPAAGPDGCR